MQRLQLIGATESRRRSFKEQDKGKEKPSSYPNSAFECSAGGQLFPIWHAFVSQVNRRFSCTICSCAAASLPNVRDNLLPSAKLPQACRTLIAEMQSLKNHVAYPSLGNHMSPGRAMRIPARWTIPERQQKHAATTVSPTASGTSGP
jgi:hypothetical protein